MMVVNRPGVTSDVTATLRDMGVSLESKPQRGRSRGEAVPVVLVTHETKESAIRAALDRIGALPTVMEKTRNDSDLDGLVRPPCHRGFGTLVVDQPGFW